MANTRIAVWMYDPAAYPNWIDEDTYYEWHSPVSPEPTAPELAAADAAAEYALANGAILLESDKSSITGNGLDAATITVTFRLPYPDYVIVSIAGQKVEIPFAPKGIGAPFERAAYITGLISDLPGEDIVVLPVEWFAPDFPGGAPLIIEVTA